MTWTLARFFHQAALAAAMAMAVGFGALAVIALALAVVLAIADTDPALAEESIGTFDDARRYAARELTSACENLQDGGFSEIRGEMARRACQVTIREGLFEFQINYRRTEGAGGGLVTKTILLGRRTSFVCSAFSDNGSARLFMTCDPDQPLSDQICSRRVHESRGGGRDSTALRSFEDVMTLPAETCQQVRRRLNFLAERSSLVDYDGLLLPDLTE